MRPEVRALIERGVLRTVAEDHDHAVQQFGLALRYLRDARRLVEDGTASSALVLCYQFLVLDLQALLSHLGLRVSGGPGEGHHRQLIAFGEAEFRDNRDEVEAARLFEPMRAQRVELTYPRAVSTPRSAGRVPAAMVTIARGTATRLGEAVPSLG